MKTNVVDMVRVRKALSELDKLVAEHPELCNPNGTRWTDNLDELDKLTMGTPAKTRVRNYRARLRAQGYRVVTIYLLESGYERLVRLSQQGGVAYGDLIGLALERYENHEGTDWPESSAKEGNRT